MLFSYRITCLVNNDVAFSSPVLGEHGLAFFVETPAGNILFDTGKSGEVLAHNLAVLDLSLKEVRHVVLSHGHFDHTGGLPYLLSLPQRFEVIGSEHLFGMKFSTRNDSLRYIGIPISRSLLEASANLILTESETEILPNVFVTGKIPMRAGFEQGDQALVIKEDDQISPDLVEDDRSMVLALPDSLIVILGCCHAGIINTLRYVQETFRKPIYAVMGGSHLKPASDQRLQATIQSLKDEFASIQQYRFGHCTGFKALYALKSAFGEKVMPLLAGETLEF